MCCRQPSSCRSPGRPPACRGHAACPWAPSGRRWRRRRRHPRRLLLSCDPCPRPPTRGLLERHLPAAPSSGQGRCLQDGPAWGPRPRRSRPVDRRGCEALPRGLHRLRRGFRRRPVPPPPRAYCWASSRACRGARRRTAGHPRCRDCCLCPRAPCDRPSLRRAPLVPARSWQEVCPTIGRATAKAADAGGKGGFESPPSGSNYPGGSTRAVSGWDTERLAEEEEEEETISPDKRAARPLIPKRRLRSSYKNTVLQGWRRDLPLFLHTDGYNRHSSQKIQKASWK